MWAALAPIAARQPIRRHVVESPPRGPIAMGQLSKQLMQTRGL